MIKGIHHAGLSVSDLDRAITYFRDAADFEWLPGVSVHTPAYFRAVTGHVNVVARNALLRGPNCYLELVAFSSPDPGEPVQRQVSEAGITHICLQFHDMQTLYDRFIRAGAHVHAAPTRLGTGIDYCYTHDHEANVIELEAVPFASHEQPPWVAHVAIATSNIERLAAFYHRVLGGQRLGGQVIGPNPLYDQLTGLKNVKVIPTWITGTNLSVELWQYLTPATLPAPRRLFTEFGYTHICFEVDDVASELEVFQAASATCETPILELDGGRAVLLRDPDGNFIELLELFSRHAEYALHSLQHRDIVTRLATLRTR